MEALEQIMYLHMMRIIPLVSSLPEKAGPAEAVEAEHGEGEREKGKTFNSGLATMGQSYHKTHCNIFTIH